ncbi:MAG: C1 family peptidase [Bacteroidota bacterium]|nr:C1 family peptidase [Bacteroidota bacterium]
MATKTRTSKKAKKPSVVSDIPDRSSSSNKNTRRILNVLPSKNLERDWSYENASDAGVLGVTAAIPSTKDLREVWWKINDQGSTGSCVGWATADSVLRWVFFKAGRIQKNQLLSPRFIWMAAKETDEFINQPTTFIEEDGTSLKAALDIARKYGSVLDDLLPFNTGQLYPNPAKTFYAIAAQLKIASYFNLGNNLGNWRTWLATKGPILTRLDVDATWDSATDNNGKLETYQPQTARGGHAVAIVGYTSKAFIVRNSWGTNWGDKGFAFASFGYAQAAFTESYGVSL